MDNEQNEQNEQKSQKESQSDILVGIGMQSEPYCDESERLFVKLEIGGHYEMIPVGGESHRHWLTAKFYYEYHKAPNTESLNQAINTLKALTRIEGKRCKLSKRVAKNKGKFFYHLADKESRVVAITSEGCKITQKAAILFEKSGGMKAQVEPDFKNGNLLLLKKHIRLRRSSDWILLLVYLVACLIADIPHPVLIIAGEKGAAKSTMLRMLKAIIDPSNRDLLVMPNAISDLALTLSKNFMACFDNMTTITSEKSDLLCMASTGGSITKRKLFTDDDEVCMSFKHCVAMNGINIVASKPDLLDRSIIIELERIAEGERKEESTLWEEFRNDLPRILGGAMNALSQAMTIYPTVKLERLFRLADFTRWGFAIAEALDIGGNKFLKAYELNQNFANDEAVESHPVAAAIVAFMKDKSTWEGPVSNLHKILARIAFNNNISTTSKVWPKAAHVLSKRLREIKSNLEKKGIYFDIRHGGDAKIITLQKRELAKKAPKKKQELDTTQEP